MVLIILPIPYFNSILRDAIAKSKIKKKIELK